MSTKRQVLGRFGELTVAKHCQCPKCKRSQTLKRLPNNFKCADLICDFCGYLAQVKATSVRSIETVPKSVLGAAWGPQKDRMTSAIYFPSFWCSLRGSNIRSSTSRQTYNLPKMFKPRKPLSLTARRAGWRGFIYDLTGVQQSFVRLK
ncbi:DpnI domain-containing protein [Bradyrhizobium arachidis]|uniref:DpnI domain-containing protein n=1 Tax=Bradyrhizobium arachidis TaxID=858423 RepID=UPI002162FBC4|nr:DpnI domain-containing protein [Bradyrhizobium arachidis]UVO34496.1 DpnI domain-containing protein [Bradyrhizobium arachidis]